MAGYLPRKRSKKDQKKSGLKIAFPLNYSVFRGKAEEARSASASPRSVLWSQGIGNSQESSVYNMVPHTAIQTKSRLGHHHLGDIIG